MAEVFELRVLFQVPIWGYAEIEAETLEDAISQVGSDAFDLDFCDTDAAPGEPEMDDIFLEVKKEGKWVSAN